MYSLVVRGLQPEWVEPPESNTDVAPPAKAEKGAEPEWSHPS